MYNEPLQPVMSLCNTETVFTHVNFYHNAITAVTGDGNHYNRYVTALRNDCSHILKTYIWHLQQSLALPPLKLILQLNDIKGDHNSLMARIGGGVGGGGSRESAERKRKGREREASLSIRLKCNSKHTFLYIRFLL